MAHAFAGRSLLTLLPMLALAWGAVNAYQALPYLRANPLTDEGMFARAKLVVARSVGRSLPVREASVDGFNQAALEVLRERPDRLKEWLRTSGGPEPRDVALVFLPGIPGSQLIRRTTANDDPIWEARRGGEDSTELWGGGRVKADDLALPRSLIEDGKPDPSIYTKLLWAYEVPIADDVDIYKEIDKRLTEIVVHYGKKVVFSYDWRLDVEVNARLLDDCIRKGVNGNRLDDSNCADLNGREVILIGHSMGGLIAWYWQQVYGRDPGPVRHIALLGAPLTGSCEMFRTLLHGYELSGSDSVLKKLGARLLLGDRLRAAAFTFPGALEVLPAVPDKAEDGCIEEPVGLGDTKASNYFRIDWWEKGVGSYLLGEPWEQLKSLGKSREERRRKFFDWFGSALAVANKFRTKSLDLSQRHIPVTYFYSRDFGTPGKARAIPDKMRRYRSIFEVMPSGDGRITRASVLHLEGLFAQPASQAGGKAFWECHERHGRLPEDERFTNWLSERLTDLHRVTQASKLAGLLAHSAELRRLFTRRGPLVPSQAEIARQWDIVPREVSLLRTAFSQDAGS